MSGPWILDRVKETSATTGTGTLTLAGAAAGFRSFAAVGDGNSCYYCITDNTDWEVGVGTYTASGTTLSRSTILASSNGGAAVSFAGGTKQVFVTSPAAWFGTPLTAGSVLFVGTNGVVNQDNSNLFWDNTNNRLGIGTASPANVLHIAAGNVSGNVKPLGITATVANAPDTTTEGAYYPFDLNGTITATDAALASDLIWMGVRSNVTYGSGGASTKGTAHAASFTHAVQGNNSNSNEHSAIFGMLRYEIGTGFTQTTGPVGRAWLLDYNLHGPIAAQPHLLNGMTLRLNNHYNGSPADTPAGAIWLVTKQAAGGGATATHVAANTYPVDVGIGIVGIATSGTGCGFTTAIQIGGTGSGWSPASSKLAIGINVRDYTTAGIYAHARFSGATCPAIAVDADGGPVVLGSATGLLSTTFLEILPAGDADPGILYHSTSSTANLSSRISNGVGECRWFVAGGAASYLTATVAGDTGFKVNTSGKQFHIGGTTKVVTVTADNKLGFFAATPIVQPANTTDLRTALIDLGLYATGGATPLNLNGGALTVGSGGAIVAGATSGTTTLKTTAVAGTTTTTLMGATGTAVTCLFTATAHAPSTTKNTTVTLIGTGVGSLTLPANFLVAGRTIRLRGKGYCTLTATSPCLLTFLFKIGSTTICTQATAYTPATAVTSAEFEYECEATCRTAGGAGSSSIIGQGRVSFQLHVTTFGTAPATIGLPATAVVTGVDTTTTNAVDFTVFQSNATNAQTLNCTNAVLEAYGGT